MKSSGIFISIFSLSCLSIFVWCFIFEKQNPFLILFATFFGLMALAPLIIDFTINHDDAKPRRGYRYSSILGLTVGIPNFLDAFNNPDVWIHERTEVTIFELLGEEQASMHVSLCDGKGTTKIGHLLTSLHCMSMERNEKGWRYVSPEEFESLCVFNRG